MSAPAKDRRAVVACGAPETARVAADLLRAGGRAADAAVGAAFAAFISEPLLTGAFGGGFATVADDAAHHAYDFFADVPGRGLGPPSEQPELDFRALEVDFGATQQIFHVGRGSVAAPSMLAGLLMLHRDHGRLPLADVVAPAIRMARDGLPIAPGQAPFFQILAPILRLTPESCALYAPEGNALEAGHLFTNPDLAKVFEDVVAGKLNLARLELVETFAPPAGRLTTTDLESSQPRLTAPLRVGFGPYEALLTPPPASGGLLVAFGLRLLESVPDAVWRDETQTYRHLLAAMAITNLVRVDEIDWARDNGNHALDGIAERILSDAFVDDWRSDFVRATRESPPVEGRPVEDLGSTTHISVIDGEGSAVGITSSNGEGCGHIVPGTGIMANNFMGEEDLHPTGFFRQPVGTRLTSMMCPTVVLEEGAPRLVLGTGGSNRIRSALLQVLTHTLLRKLPIETAVRAPRMHYEGGCLYVEHIGPGSELSKETVRHLSEAAHDTVVFESPNMFFGGVHAAASNGHGAGDPRRGGVAWIAGEPT